MKATGAFFRCCAFLLIGCGTSAAAGLLAADFARQWHDFLTKCLKFQSPGGCGELLVQGHPIRLTAGSIAPQNGFGLGGAFVFEKNTPNWRFKYNADAVESFSGSWRAGLYVKAIHSTSAPPVPIDLPQRPKTTPNAELTDLHPEYDFYSQGISLNTIRFYGPGPGSAQSGVTLYGMRELITGASGMWPLGRSGVRLLAETNWRVVDIRGNSGQKEPSIESIYSNVTAPGLVSQPQFLQLGGGARFERGTRFVALDYLFKYRQFLAPGDTHNSFGAITVNLIHQKALYTISSAAPPPQYGPDGPMDTKPLLLDSVSKSRNRVGSITVQAFLNASFVPSAHAVPFYFQPTLGGSDINGVHTLESYGDYRFRAPNLMLYRAEFEQGVWRFLGFVAGADYGTVAMARSDLAFEHMHHSFYTGLTVRLGGLPRASITFSWGGREGNHTTAYLDPSVLGGSPRPSLN